MVASQFASVDYPECREVQLSTKFFSALPAELVQVVLTSSLGLGLLVSLGFVYVDGHGDEPGHLGFQLSEKSNGVFLNGADL